MDVGNVWNGVKMTGDDGSVVGGVGRRVKRRGLGRMHWSREVVCKRIR